MANNISLHSKRNLFLFIILLLIAISGSYYYNRSLADQRIANQAYQQLTIIDGQLNELQGTVQQLTVEKSTNAQLAAIISGLTKDNFFASKSQLLSAISKLNYDQKARAKFESQIAAATTANIKTQLKLLKETMREVKYQQNLDVTAFNQQISQITTQVVAVKLQIMKIKSADLQQLELAKLDFISKKLNKTVHQLSNTFFATLIDDVVGAAINGAESQANSGAAAN